MRECGWDTTSRTADTRGARMGQQVAEWALDHYFRPAGHH